VQGTFLSRARSPARGLLAQGCAALLACAAQPCVAAGAQVSIEVPQGKTKTVRLRQLPRGTVLGVAISVSGKLLIALVSAAQLKSPKPEPLFRGAVDSKMSFKVEIPEASDYYLVLDNRQHRAGQGDGDDPRRKKRRATLRAAAPEGRQVERGARRRRACGLARYFRTRAARLPSADLSPFSARSGAIGGCAGSAACLPPSRSTIAAKLRIDCRCR
jgi:hypothetical protein